MTDRGTCRGRGKGGGRRRGGERGRALGRISSTLPPTHPSTYPPTHRPQEELATSLQRNQVLAAHLTLTLILTLTPNPQPQHPTLTLTPTPTRSSPHTCPHTCTVPGASSCAGPTSHPWRPSMAKVRRLAVPQLDSYASSGSGWQLLGRDRRLGGATIASGPRASRLQSRPCYYL